MKLAFVVPRYGTEIVGGAEWGARMLAERLAARPGWSVEVFTTAARESTTWADAYPPGESLVEGVRVRRFSSASGRAADFAARSDRVLAAPGAATSEESERWLELQGPVCPDLVEAAVAGDAELIACYPYLYHPIVSVLRRAGGRAVLHPAAHDEAPIYLPSFTEAFGSAQGLVFHTDGERRLVEGLFPVAERRQIVLGLGVDPYAGERDGASALGLGERPFICCIGRVDDLKGTSLLAELFAAYKARRPGPLALVLAGPVAVAPIEHPDVVVCGVVDEATKWELLERSLALVSPSPYESFSVVLMEGWLAGRPALVNAACDATREHCQASGGGLWFDGYARFEAALDRLLEDACLRRSLGEAGRRHVERHFRWPTVVDRYAAFLQGVAAARD